MSKPGKNEMITRIDYFMREGAIIAPIDFEAARKRAAVYGRSMRDEIIMHSCPSDYNIQCPQDCYNECCLDCWLKYMFIPRKGQKE